LENLKERPIGNHTRSWEDNIKMDLKEIGWEWIGLVCLRTGTSGGSPVNAVMNLWVQ
jgi:hypothetical protein